MDTFPSRIKADDRRNEPGALLPCTLTSGQARQRTVFRGTGTLACATLNGSTCANRLGRRRYESRAAIDPLSVSIGTRPQLSSSRIQNLLDTWCRI